jgi:hypothetical protein
LPGKRQAKKLGISQGSVYYLPRPVSSEDLAIMRDVADADKLNPVLSGQIRKHIHRPTFDQSN